MLTGRGPVAWQLYLPEIWAEDDARRQKAGTPKDIGFATEPQIALQQLSALPCAYWWVRCAASCLPLIGSMSREHDGIALCFQGNPHRARRLPVIAGGSCSTVNPGATQTHSFTAWPGIDSPVELLRDAAAPVYRCACCCEQAQCPLPADL